MADWLRGDANWFLPWFIDGELACSGWQLCSLNLELISIAELLGKSCRGTMFYLIVVACDNVGDKCYSPVFIKLDEVSLYL